LLPGWQLAIPPTEDEPFDQLVSQQKLTYAVIAVLAIAAIALTTLAVVRASRRQLQLARLKTDLVAAVSHELKTPLASMRVLVEALLEDANPSPTKTHEYLEMIARENARL